MDYSKAIYEEERQQLCRNLVKRPHTSSAYSKSSHQSPEPLLKKARAMLSPRSSNTNGSNSVAVEQGDTEERNNQGVQVPNTMASKKTAGQSQPLLSRKKESSTAVPQADTRDENNQSVPNDTPGEKTAGQKQSFSSSLNNSIDLMELSSDESINQEDAIDNTSLPGTYRDVEHKDCVSKAEFDEKMQMIESELMKIKKRMRKGPSLPTSPGDSASEEEITLYNGHSKARLMDIGEHSSSLFDRVFKLMTMLFTDDEILKHSVSGKAPNSKTGAKPKFDQSRYGMLLHVVQKTSPKPVSLSEITHRIHAVQKKISKRFVEKGKQAL
ncbi:uncharacterized protein [Ptychodera flava]|uniref:uncharacterized protein isoform X2 n=1 Tax=Ptychodera flava TaxID=63121 RepID=UPI00396A6AA3